MIDLTKERGSGAPIGNNGMKTKSLFYERLYYKENIKPKSDYDFWYSNPYYGRIDHAATPVYVNESFLLPISDSQYALNFVVKAFQDLQEYIRQAVASKKVNQKSLLNVLLVSKAWRSVLTDYYDLIHEHLQAFVDGYLASSLRNLTKVTNLRTFVKEYMAYAALMSKITPITRSAYILSQKCSPLVSGLIVELAGYSHDQDMIKNDLYFKDPNWRFYELATGKFGFAVDPNAPWRLVARIGSAYMRKKMAEFNVTFENIFDTLYFKSYMTDYFSFVTYMTEMYRLYRQMQPEVGIPRVCQETGRVYEQKIVREDSNEFSVPYSEWLSAYLRIRVNEQGLTWTDSVFSLHLAETITVAKSYGMAQALEYMEKKTGGLDKLAFPKYREEAFQYKQEQ